MTEVFNGAGSTDDMLAAMVAALATKEHAAIDGEHRNRIGCFKIAVAAAQLSRIALGFHRHERGEALRTLRSQAARIGLTIQDDPYGVYAFAPKIGIELRLWEAAAHRKQVG